MSAEVADRAHVVDVEYRANGYTAITGARVAVHTCRVCGLITVNEAPPLPCRGVRP